jgi:hypothetical protein
VDKLKTKIDVWTKKKNELTITADGTSAIDEGTRVRDALELKFRTPITQIIRVIEQNAPPPRKAYGGFFNRATNVIVGEAGPEVIIPLSKPQRARQLMESAGLMPLGADNPQAATGDREARTYVFVTLDSKPIAARVRVVEREEARRQMRTKGLGW